MLQGAARGLSSFNEMIGFPNLHSLLFTAYLLPSLARHAPASVK
jgi:hypothetical protein